jgi:hypothetical protein
MRYTVLVLLLMGCGQLTRHLLVGNLDADSAVDRAFTIYTAPVILHNEVGNLPYVTNQVMRGILPYSNTLGTVSSVFLGYVKEISRVHRMTVKCTSFACCVLW